MSIIRKGDMILTSKGHFVATSEIYVKILSGTGEYVNDYRTEARIDVLDPSTGQTSFLRVSEALATP